MFQQNTGDGRGLKINMNDPIWWTNLKNKTKWHDNHSQTLEYIQIMNDFDVVVNLSATSEYVCSLCAAKIKGSRIYEHVNLHKPNGI